MNVSEDSEVPCAACPPQWATSWGTVVGRRPKDQTYNLDIRDHADCDRIRIRVMTSLGPKVSRHRGQWMTSRSSGRSWSPTAGVSRSPMGSCLARSSYLIMGAKMCEVGFERYV